MDTEQTKKLYNHLFGIAPIKSRKRIIRFRAWDNNRKIMIGEDYPDNWGENMDEWWADQAAMHLIGIEGINNDKDFEVMQYTGLKDRNGKKIYEGDIVNYRGDNCVKEQLGMRKAAVRWSEFEAGFSLDSDAGEMLTYEVHEGSLEVIGNIYENPELLTNP